MIEVKYLKVSVPIEGSKLPRDILPPEGSPGSAKATVSLQFKAGDIEFTASLKVKGYRDALNKIDAAPYGAFAVLQGKLGPTSGVLTEAGLIVQANVPKETTKA